MDDDVKVVGSGGSGGTSISDSGRSQSKELQSKGLKRFVKIIELAPGRATRPYHGPTKEP